MPTEIINLECPHCGVAVSMSQEVCEYCNKPIVFVNYSNVQNMTLPEVNKCVNSYRKTLVDNPDNRDINISLALCYLRLKLYDKAIECFEKAMDNNFDQPDVFFYAAVCLLKGQKAFVAQRKEIDKCMEYLNAAIEIEPKGIYMYFLAYIKYDYFNRKYLKISPDWREVYELAHIEYSVTDEEINNLHALLAVSRPDCLK